MTLFMIYAFILKEIKLSVVYLRNTVNKSLGWIYLKSLEYFVFLGIVPGIVFFFFTIIRSCDSLEILRWLLILLPLLLTWLVIVVHMNLVIAYFFILLPYIGAIEAVYAARYGTAGLFVPFLIEEYYYYGAIHIWPNPGEVENMPPPFPLPLPSELREEENPALPWWHEDNFKKTPLPWWHEDNFKKSLPLTEQPESCSCPYCSAIEREKNSDIVWTSENAIKNSDKIRKEIIIPLDNLRRYEKP